MTQSSLPNVKSWSDFHPCRKKYRIRQWIFSQWKIALVELHYPRQTDWDGTDLSLISAILRNAVNIESYIISLRIPFKRLGPILCNSSTIIPRTSWCFTVLKQGLQFRLSLVQLPLPIKQYLYLVCLKRQEDKTLRSLNTKKSFELSVISKHYRVKVNNGCETEKQFPQRLGKTGKKVMLWTKHSYP